MPTSSSILYELGGATANRRNIPWDGQRPEEASLNEFFRSRWTQKNPPLANEFFDLDAPINARGVLYLCEDEIDNRLTLLVQRVPLHQHVPLLPHWAEDIICGVVETDLPLSPSRELPRSDSRELRQLRKILKKRLFRMLKGLEKRPQTLLDVWQSHGKRLKAAALLDPEALPHIGRTIVRFSSSKRTTVTINQYVERVLRSQPDLDSATVWYTTDRWMQAARQVELDRKDVEVLFVDGPEGEQMLLSIEKSTGAETPCFHVRRIDDGEVTPTADDENITADGDESDPADPVIGVFKTFASQVLGPRVAEVSVTSFEPKNEAARLVRPPIPKEMRQLGPMMEGLARAYSDCRDRPRDDWPSELKRFAEFADTNNLDFDRVLEDQLATVSRRRLLLNWSNDDVRRVAAVASRLTGQSTDEHKLFNSMVEQLLLSARIGAGEPLEGKELATFRDSADRFLALALNLLTENEVASKSAKTES